MKQKTKKKQNDINKHKNKQPSTITKQVSSPALIVPTNIQPLSPPKPFPIAPLPINITTKVNVLNNIDQMRSHRIHIQTHTYLDHNPPYKTELIARYQTQRRKNKTIFTKNKLNWHNNIHK